MKKKQPDDPRLWPLLREWAAGLTPPLGYSRAIRLARRAGAVMVDGRLRVPPGAPDPRRASGAAGHMRAK